jgi:hypothetical protein
MRKLLLLSASMLVAAMVAAPAIGASASGNAGQGGSATKNGFTIRDWHMLSSGGQLYFKGPNHPGSGHSSRPLGPLFGTNTDPNDPSQDTGGGQSETAIGAAGKHLVAAWNDVSGFFAPSSTTPQGSVTGVAYSSDGAQTWQDLIGLRNNRPTQGWGGDPTVVAIDRSHFLVGSLYLPSQHFARCRSRLQLAVESIRVLPDGSLAVGLPVIAADGGTICDPNAAFLDKEFMSYDPTTRTLAMSYTRFLPFNYPTTCGNGQIEVVRATVPPNAATITGSDFSSPIVVQPDSGCQSSVFASGAYPAVSPNGDIYVAWENNIQSNQFDGNPYVYIMAAEVRAGATTPTTPVTVTINQQNAQPDGGVKSLDNDLISGYSRGIGQDFPRIAFNAARNRVEIEWNDASLHPLGDIFLKELLHGLSNNATAPVRQVNDDQSYALHFLPAVSVRSDGTVCSSWYDRHLWGADSTKTDYYGECRDGSGANAADFRITTGATDWAGTSSLLNPNFGDYTDNTSSGTTTYFIWSDGRIGVPQPFVDSH